MITLFQITGSCSFAARAALEEAAAEYRSVDVHPRRREEAPGFLDANPLGRVPVLVEGDTVVYETSAVLHWIAERFPEARLAPVPGNAERARFLTWMSWLGNDLHRAWLPLQVPMYLTTDERGHAGIREKGVEYLSALGAHLERELEGREWLAGAFSVADLYLYMLVCWRSYSDDHPVGGNAVEAHYARVGARPAVARTRVLDDLDERLQRFHPELRGGVPL